MKDLTEHNIKVDDNININLKIPKELTAEEFEALFTKANRLVRTVAVYNVKDITTPNIPALKRPKFSRWTEQELGMLRAKQHIYHQWNDKEVAFLKANYKKISNTELGKKLGVTGKQVIDKAHYLKNHGKW